MMSPLFYLLLFTTIIVSGEILVWESFRNSDCTIQDSLSVGSSQVAILDLCTRCSIWDSYPKALMFTDYKAKQGTVDICTYNTLNACVPNAEVDCLPVDIGECIISPCPQSTQKSTPTIDPYGDKMWIKLRLADEDDGLILNTKCQDDTCDVETNNPILWYEYTKDKTTCASVGKLDWSVELTNLPTAISGGVDACGPYSLTHPSSDDENVDICINDPCGDRLGQGCLDTTYQYLTTPCDDLACPMCKTQKLCTCENPFTGITTGIPSETFVRNSYKWIKATPLEDGGGTTTSDGDYTDFNVVIVATAFSIFLFL